MSFPAEILRSGIQIADSLTAGVQCIVTYERYLGSDGDGDETFDDPTTVQCVVDQTKRQKTTSSGRLETVLATLTFPRALSFTIGPKDRIVLPDGTTGPLILDSPDAVVDPGTGRGFIQTVMIGEVATQTGA